MSVLALVQSWLVRAAEIFDRWFIATILGPKLGRGRAIRRMAELAEIRDRILTEATIAPTADVLDLGCGSGFLTWAAGEEAGLAIGVDTHPDVLTRARGVPAIGAAFVCARPDTLPFEQSTFDVVIWRGTFGTADATRLLPEVHRVLRRDARLCFSEPLIAEIDVSGADESLKRLWETLRDAAEPPSRYALEAMVEASGFSGVRVQVERRRVMIEDQRAVHEILEPVVYRWSEAGAPSHLAQAFIDALAAVTPAQIILPEAYVTATKT